MTARFGVDAVVDAAGYTDDTFLLWVARVAGLAKSSENLAYNSDVLRFGTVFLGLLGIPFALGGF